MTTGFSSGMRARRVTIYNKVQPSERQFGEKTGYRSAGSLWSSYKFNKGAKSLREGALDAYDTVMFQMNFSSNITITRDSLIELNNRIYQIISLNDDPIENKIVITATEMTTQVNIIPEPYSTAELTPTTESDI
jgi:head-tail adaptor